ncbi:hypothetical protein [Ramlibacter sp. WS9]|uniref:hypothetical protein n=1 Tax=Ramlibacter sp. WS9 TaxID=1882741 RepID=UPI001144EA12|nr:hypothetical protein [Ramlibacter sp. WS9]
MRTHAPPYCLNFCDVETAANRIRQREIPQAPSRSTVNRPETLLAVLAGRPHDIADGASLELALAQREFLARMRWDGLPRFLTRDAAGPVIETLSHWFCAVNGRAGSDFESRLAELERRSRFKERTRRFIAGTKSTRCDFTNLGGIDIELCNIAGYYPRFKLASSASDSVPPHIDGPRILMSLPLAFSTLHQRS